MNIILWVAQIFLASVFLYSGICKSIYSEKQLVAKGQTGVAGLPSSLIRFIGISDIIGATGLILPWLLNILPVLTPIAAVCFSIVMALAALIHHRLKEPRNVAVNIAFLVICLFVAWGRWQNI